jgi:cobyrinic acid a,c-diamide synthase
VAADAQQHQLGTPSIIVVGNIVKSAGLLDALARRRARARDDGARPHHRGSRSGAGKTTVTLGLLAALKRRGIAVRAAKAGPDYIDPAFHAAATGARGFNLDTWAMPPRSSTACSAKPRGIANCWSIEGVMGLFDGVPGPRGAPERRRPRRPFGFPVLLVLDVSAQAQSAAAVVRASVRTIPTSVSRASCSTASAASAIACWWPMRSRSSASGRGRAAARRHHPSAGAAPRPRPGREHDDLPRRLDRLADWPNGTSTSTPSRALARRSGCTSRPQRGRAAAARTAHRARLGRGVYIRLCASARSLARPVPRYRPFRRSPTSRRRSCDVCWLPGGYPELHAGQLAAARRFQRGLARFAETQAGARRMRRLHGARRGIEDAEACATP